MSRADTRRGPGGAGPVLDSNACDGAGGDPHVSTLIASATTLPTESIPALIDRVLLEAARGRLKIPTLLSALGLESVAVSGTGMIHAVANGRPRCGVRRVRRAWMAVDPTCRSCRKILGGES